MEAFIPPSISLPVTMMVDAAYPVLLKQYQNIDKINIAPEDLKMLRTLKKERLIFLSNHPSNGEPPLAYYVAMKMGARFHYMASRHVFDMMNGVVGRLIRNVGAFSVLAGSSDKKAVQTAQDILTSPGGKMVLYPEGEPTSGENDGLMPLQPGVAFLGLKSLDRLLKVEPDADIKVLPAFIKYRMQGTEVSIKAELHSSLSKLEKICKIDPGNMNLLRRFLVLGQELLEQAESRFGIKPDESQDFNYRIGRVRHAQLDKIARDYEIRNYPEAEDAIHKLRFIMAIVEQLDVGITDSRLPDLDRGQLAQIKKELGQAYDFIVIRPSYLIKRPTAERFFEWLVRFETHLTGKTNLRARDAFISFAPAFSLREYRDSYLDNKKEAVQALTERLEQELRSLLQDSLQLTQPLVRAVYETEEMESLK